MIVIIAIFAMLFIGTSISKVNADDNYQFGTVYQYYLLDNRKSDTTTQADNQKVAKVLGKIGSGGISGSFSYDDMVTSAPNSATAKSFSSMMATYSTFHYFSTAVQGFNGTWPMLGRYLIYAILFIPALLLDILNMMVQALFSLFSSLNIISVLAEALTNQKFSSQMADALQINMSQVKTLNGILIILSLSVFLFGLFMMLRRGSNNLDQKYLHKTKGRLVNFLFLNVVIVLCATLLSSVNEKLDKVKAFDTGSNFASYLIDDRAWAYNYNFAPNGNNSSSSDISPSNKSYVDLAFNPYLDGKDDKGSKRIQDINSSSSFLNNGNSLFSNSALLLSFGASDTFSATDYINYKGTQDSENLLGGASGQSFGSYYSYANSMGKNLVDTDHTYNPSGSVASDNPASGPFSKSIDDYKNDKGNLTLSPSTTWRDRFIYGVKDSGSMDSYYGEEPGSEMINNHVGAGSQGNTISDQSMYFVLSTRFNETGGTFSIPSPGRGIKGKMAQYDSDRNSYYVVSMVGTPLITTFALLTKPLTVIVILLAMVMAIFSLGIVDMNLRPLSAYFKSLILGDPEYTEAFGVYAIGITGTALTIRVFPQLFQNLIDKVSSIVALSVPTITNQTPQTPQAALMLGGVSIIVGGLVSCVFALLFAKAPSFREKVIYLFTIIWEWAKTTGNRLELQANPYSQRLDSASKEAISNNPIHRALLKSNEAGESLDKTLKHAPKNLMNEVLPNRFSHNDKDSLKNNDNPEKVDPNNDTNKVLTPQQIKRRGRLDRINNDLQDIQNSPNSTNATVSDAVGAEDALNKFKAEPTQKNLDNAQDKLLALRQRMVDNNAPEEDIAKVDQALKELQDLGSENNLKVKPVKPIIDPNKDSKESPWKDDLKSDDNDLTGKKEPNKTENSNNDGKNGSKKDSNNSSNQKNNDKNDDSKGSDINDSRTNSNHQESNKRPRKTQRRPDRVKTIKTIENETERHIHEENKHNLNENNVNKNSETRSHIASTNQTTKNVDVNNVKTLNKRLVNTTQVKALNSSLGNSSNNPQIRRAMRTIRVSNNKDDLNKGINDLRKSIKDLRPSQKRSINKKRMINTLNNILK